jgi:myosin heavy subunit
LWQNPAHETKLSSDPRGSSDIRAVEDIVYFLEQSLPLPPAHAFPATDLIQKLWGQLRHRERLLQDLQQVCVADGDMRFIPGDRMAFLKRLQDAAGIPTNLNELRNLAEQHQASLFDLKTEAARFESLMAGAREQEAASRALLSEKQGQVEQMRTEAASAAQRNEADVARLSQQIVQLKAQIDDTTAAVKRESLRAAAAEAAAATSDDACRAVALENGQLQEALLEARQLAADAVESIALKAQQPSEDATGERPSILVDAQTSVFVESKLHSLEVHHETIVKELEGRLSSAHDTMQRFAIANEELTIANEELTLDLDTLKSQAAACQSTIRDLELQLERTEAALANESGVCSTKLHDRIKRTEWGAICRLG